MRDIWGWSPWLPLLQTPCLAPESEPSPCPVLPIAGIALLLCRGHFQVSAWCATKYQNLSTLTPARGVAPEEGRLPHLQCRAHTLRLEDGSPLFRKHDSRDSQTQPHASLPSRPDITAIFWSTVILWEDKGLPFAPSFSAPLALASPDTKKLHQLLPLAIPCFLMWLKAISSMWACSWLFQPLMGGPVVACNHWNSVNSKMKILDYLSNVNQNLALQIKATESGCVTNSGVFLKYPLPIGTADETKNNSLVSAALKNKTKKTKTTQGPWTSNWQERRRNQA